MNQAAVRDKYRIAVLMGGKSIEREVSFNSGRTICDHLDSSLYEVVPLFQREDGRLFFLPWHFLHRGKISDFLHRLENEATPISWDELKQAVDFVYIAVHGRYAEDGTLQGMLEILGIPYLGAKVFGSAMGMNKVTQKTFLKHMGVDVPAGFFVSASAVDSLTHEALEAERQKAHLNFPIIVKPSHEGSSLGISVVRNAADLLPAVHFAATIHAGTVQDVIVEEKIEGMEFVCVSLERVNPLNTQERSWFSFPITEIVREKGSDIFDYDQKYMPGRALKLTPARCADESAELIKKTCEKAARLLNFETIARIDGILTKEGRIVIIDPNSLTGTGPATFLFHQAAEAGYSHGQLINFLLENELLKYGMTGLHPKTSKDVAMEENQIKMRVAVFLGGDSNEREVSLESGRNVCYKLSPHKYEVIPVFVDDHMDLYRLDQRLVIKNTTQSIAELVKKEDRIAWSDLPKVADFVFIALHGGRGENGAVQGALEMLGIPYNGPGVLASSLCMNKSATNRFLKSWGFSVPASVLVDRTEWFSFDLAAQKKFIQKKLLKELNGYPVVVKPHDDGCSVMVSKITQDESLVSAINGLFEHGKTHAMVEEFVQGMELTVGVLGNESPMALPPTQTVTRQDVLSMKEKFLPGAGENLTPAPLPAETLLFVRHEVQEAFKALGAMGYSRIDCFYQSPEISPTGKERVVFLEVNTLPALTPATCFFHQAAEIGMKPMDVIDQIVQFGFAAKKERLWKKPAEQLVSKPGEDQQVTLF